MGLLHSGFTELLRGDSSRCAPAYGRIDDGLRLIEIPAKRLNEADPPPADVPGTVTYNFQEPKPDLNPKPNQKL